LALEVDHPKLLPHTTGRRAVLFLAVCAFLQLCALPCLCTRKPAKPRDRLAPILAYIHSDWALLTRSMNDCRSVADPKLTRASRLYLPKGFPEPAAVRTLEKSCNVQVLYLPVPIDHPGATDVDIRQHGLLYLPNPYVVPGGRFNEMYGWDSYFIILGLLRDGERERARGMVENFFFEIQRYGTLLNANRTYYLTRSQPPFLTSMILQVYRAQQESGHGDNEWLKIAYEFAARDYQMWTRDPHLAGATGLSRYFDFGDGPAPESVAGEPGYYRSVARYFLLHPDLGRRYLTLPAGIDPARASPDDVRLNSLYYKGDRSMRESGFDISFRFRPYGAGTQDFAPVCLNSLLYKTEKDLEEMARALGRPDAVQSWRQRADVRRRRIDQYLWDPSRGLYFDYNFATGSRSGYEYATTFYPLWAGAASPEQAKAVAGNLRIFERSGGLATSTQTTGVQWDYPYGWAPLQLLAVQGLRRYGFDAEANRVAEKFLSTVAADFEKEGTIREKYNVVTRSSDAPVVAGYRTNVIGFGWTNGVFVELLHQLPPPLAQELSAGPSRTSSVGP